MSHYREQSSRPRDIGHNRNIIAKRMVRKIRTPGAWHQKSVAAQHSCLWPHDVFWGNIRQLRTPKRRSQATVTTRCSSPRPHDVSLWKTRHDLMTSHYESPRPGPLVSALNRAAHAATSGCCASGDPHLMRPMPTTAHPTLFARHNKSLDTDTRHWLMNTQVTTQASGTGSSIRIRNTTTPVPLSCARYLRLHLVTWPTFIGHSSRYHERAQGPGTTICNQWDYDVEY